MATLSGPSVEIGTSTGEAGAEKKAARAAAVAIDKAPMRRAKW
jgi:hypothetical protein